MAKWYGNVGFADTIEYEPGAWEETVVEHPYYGDILFDHWKRENSGGVNDNVNLSHRISIVADSYAHSHCSSMVYVEYMNEKWKITDIEVQYPRLILSIGGLWNG